MPDRRLRDAEWIAFEAGVKPALRSSIDPDRLAEATARMGNRGFAVALAPRLAELPGRDAQAIFYVARDPRVAQALVEVETPILPSPTPGQPGPAEFEAHRSLGRLLGFPPCCVDAFVDRLPRGVTRRISGGDANEDFVAAEEALSRTSRPHGRLNDLLARTGLRLVSFYPCRYDCPAALEHADAIWLAYQTAAPNDAPLLEAGLRVAVRLAPDGSRTTGAGSPGPDHLKIDFSSW